MNRFSLFLFLLLTLAFAPLVGCDSRPAATPTTGESKNPDDKNADDPEADIRESLAKLSDADRKLAEEQKYCAVMENKRLGAMGTPLKLTVKDRPVFLCCKGCQRKALADPDKTLAKVESQKTRAANEKGK